MKGVSRERSAARIQKEAALCRHINGAGSGEWTLNLAAANSASAIERRNRQARDQAPRRYVPTNNALGAFSLQRHPPNRERSKAPTLYATTRNRRPSFVNVTNSRPKGANSAQRNPKRLAPKARNAGEQSDETRKNLRATLASCRAVWGACTDCCIAADC